MTSVYKTRTVRWPRLEVVQETSETRPLRFHHSEKECPCQPPSIARTCRSRRAINAQGGPLAEEATSLLERYIYCSLKEKSLSHIQEEILLCSLKDIVIKKGVHNISVTEHNYVEIVPEASKEDLANVPFSKVVVCTHTTLPWHLYYQGGHETCDGQNCGDDQRHLGFSSAIKTSNKQWSPEWSSGTSDPKNEQLKVMKPICKSGESSYGPSFGKRIREFSDCKTARHEIVTDKLQNSINTIPLCLLSQLKKQKRISVAPATCNKFLSKLIYFLAVSLSTNDWYLYLLMKGTS